MTITAPELVAAGLLVNAACEIAKIFTSDKRDTQIQQLQAALDAALLQAGKLIVK